jgi:hypothetical protein
MNTTTTPPFCTDVVNSTVFKIRHGNRVRHTVHFQPTPGTTPAARAQSHGGRRRLLKLATLAALGTIVGGNANAAVADLPVPDLVPEWLRRLTAKGLPQTLAQSLVKLNRWHFEVLAENNPVELRSMLTELSRLGQHPKTWNAIARQPEVAGLLATAIDHGDEGAEKLANVLDESEEQRTAFNNFCRINTLAPADCIEATETYRLFGDLIGELAERKVEFPESFFQELPRVPDAHDTYVRFVREFLADALRKARVPGDAKLTQKLEYLRDDTFELRELLDNDAEFRARFMGTHFPALRRLASQQGGVVDILALLQTPYIWETLALPNGEAVLKNYGIQAAYSLKCVSGKSYDVHRGNLLRAMLAQNDDVVQFILRDLNTPELTEFLKNPDIPEGTKFEIIAENSSDPNAAGRFKYYNKLSPTALLEERYETESTVDSIPILGSVAGTYKTVKKMVQGREYTFLELALPVADIAMYVGAFATGGGTLAISTAIKGALKQGANIAAKRLAAAAGKQALKSGVKASGSNISAIARAAFRLARACGIKASTFKKLIKLDPRIFMRSDRKVMLEVPELYKEIAADSGINFIVSTDAAKGIIAEVSKKATAASDTLAKRINKIPISLEQYASFLWLNTTTGKLDKHLKKMKNIA